MKLDKKTYQTLAFLIGGAILFNWILNNTHTIKTILSGIWSLIFPFILGLIIAYLLNIPMRAIENRFLQKRKRKRVLSFAITLILFVIIITFISILLIPQLASTVATLAASMPGYMQRIEENLTPYMSKIPSLSTLIQNLNLDWKSVGSKILSVIGTGASNFLGSAFNVATSIISGATSLAIGIIFACYVLFEKERLAAQTKGFLQAYLSAKNYSLVIEYASMTDKIFSRFVSGQCLESVAVCLMFLVGLSIGRFDYVLLISVLIGFMSLIPILGSFIGCIIGALLILVSSGVWRMVAFLIVFLILQQIDGNITYPRIVGNSIGLPPIWVLVAVTIGGGLMGIFGMLFFLPLTSVIYTVTRKKTLARLEEKGVIPAGTDDPKNQNKSTINQKPSSFLKRNKPKNKK